MGIPNVFSIETTLFIGIGIGFDLFCVDENKRALDIMICLPFLEIGIFFHKSVRNRWF